MFKDTTIKITKEVHRHLGAVIGSQEFKAEYCQQLIKDWVQQLENLSEIAKIEPQSAYSAFISGFQGKLTFYMRTIKGIEQFLQPIEDTIRNKFIPAISEGRHCSDDERELLSLPTRYGGMGIKNPVETAKEEFENSKKLTKQMSSLLYEQSTAYKINITENNSIKTNIKKQREVNYENKINDLRTRITPQQLKTNNINREKGVSSWLTTLPLEKYGFTLSKREFWDAINIRYNWPLSRLPTKCICGAAFDIQHALSCKRGGFVIIRHNNLRDLIAEQLQEVCHDVKIEPQLEQITGEVINGNISAEARSDISARGFWVKGQIAFFDIRVFDPNARRYTTRNLTQCYKSNETEKKK